MNLKHLFYNFFCEIETFFNLWREFFLIHKWEFNGDYKSQKQILIFTLKLY